MKITTERLRTATTGNVIRVGEMFRPATDTSAAARIREAARAFDSRLERRGRPAEVVGRIGD